MKEEFKQLQSNLQLTNAALAKKLNVTERTIERWRSPTCKDEPTYVVMLVMRSATSKKAVKL